MKKEYYYVSLLSCNRRNIREKMLAEYLKSYKDCLVEFGEEYTQKNLIADLNKRLEEINSPKKHCWNICLKRGKGQHGEIIFEFKSDVDFGIQSAIMILRPVRRWFPGSSNLEKSDAE